MQLVRDARDVIDQLIDPAEVLECDELEREIHPFVAGEMVQIALEDACSVAMRWETPQDQGSFFYYVAAEAAIKLVEYRDNILVLGEPPSHQMTQLRDSGQLPGWGFIDTCALLLSSKLIKRQYKKTLNVRRSAQLERFKAHLDRVANKQTTHTRDLALILQDLASPDQGGVNADGESATSASAAAPDLGHGTAADGQGAPSPEAARNVDDGSASHGRDDEAAQRTLVGNGSVNGPVGSREINKDSRRSRTFKGFLVISAVVMVLALIAAAGGRGWVWDRSGWQPVPPSPGPQQPPFPRDALAQIGMPLKPNVLLRLTGDGIQRWTSQSVSGSAPGLSVPLDITPGAGDEDQHKVIKVSLDLQLRDPGRAADPGLLISASGDYPLSIKDGGDYSTTSITPEQPNPKKTHPLTAKGDDTPLSLHGNGVWTFQFYVDFGDPALYQCGYHVRSINAFAELDPKYPDSKSPNSKIVDTLPVALLRKC